MAMSNGTGQLASGSAGGVVMVYHRPAPTELRWALATKLSFRAGPLKELHLTGGTQPIAHLVGVGRGTCFGSVMWRSSFFIVQVAGLAVWRLAAEVGESVVRARLAWYSPDVLTCPSDEVGPSP